METELKEIMGLPAMEKGQALIKLGHRFLKQLQKTHAPEKIADAEQLIIAMLNCRYEIGHNKATELVGANEDYELYELEKALKEIVQKLKSK